MTPLVSIGIAFRNPGAYFAEALRSVFAQTYDRWELLLIDDGSTDGSVELARSLDDSRVHLAVDGMRRGLSVRLNQIASMARGEFLFRMDADDIMHPERVARQTAMLSDGPANMVLGTHAYSIGERSELLGLRHPANPDCTGFEVRRAFLHPTVAARAEWFRDNPYSEEPIFSRSEDAELWCRTVARSHFAVLDRPLLYYRESGALQFERYMSTAAGVLTLLTARYRRPFSGFAYRVIRELFKVGVYALGSGNGLTGVVGRRKYRALNDDELREASENLDQVLRVELPVARAIAR